jgi:hypothetical protein
MQKQFLNSGAGEIKAAAKRRNLAKKCGGKKWGTRAKVLASWEKTES